MRLKKRPAFIQLASLIILALVFPAFIFGQTPTFVNMGGFANTPTPTLYQGGAQPTLIPTNPAPPTNTPLPDINQPPAGQISPQTTSAPTPVQNWIPNVNCIPVEANSANSINEAMQSKNKKRSRKGNNNNNQGLFREILKLIQQLMDMIRQLLGAGGGALPGMETPGTQRQTTAPGQQNPVGVQNPANPQNPGGGAQNPAATLPPCPENTPTVAQGGTNQPALPQIGGGQQATVSPGQQAGITPGPALSPTQSASAPAINELGYPNVAQTPQCAGAEPPPGAEEAGMTKLVFCEDFSDPSRIDFDNNPIAGKTTFVGMRPGNIFSAQTEVSSDFSWTPQGTLISKSRHDNYQSDFISTWPTGGGGHAGFDTGAKPFYAEASVKHNQWNSGGARGFFAFWAMDTCHLYNTGCSSFYEPDFYEFISRMHVNAFHWWSSSMQKQDSSCITTQSAGISPNGKDTQFNTYGARFTNEGSNYYFNDKANIANACASKSWSKTIPQGPQPGKTGRYPIIIGSGPNQNYEVDFVRVWQAP